MDIDAARDAPGGARARPVLPDGIPRRGDDLLVGMEGEVAVGAEIEELAALVEDAGGGYGPQVPHAPVVPLLLDGADLPGEPFLHGRTRRRRKAVLSGSFFEGPEARELFLSGDEEDGPNRGEGSFPVMVVPEA